MTTAKRRSTISSVPPKTTRTRQGRGGPRANSGGRREGAGRPKANGEGYVELGVRLGPEQIARARELAAALGVKPAEVYRRALHGLVQLGPATSPYRRQTLQVLPGTRARIREMAAQAANGDAAALVRAIFSGGIAHL